MSIPIGTRLIGDRSNYGRLQLNSHRNYANVSSKQLTGDQLARSKQAEVSISYFLQSTMNIRLMLNCLFQRRSYLNFSGSAVIRLIGKNSVEWLIKKTTLVPIVGNSELKILSFSKFHAKSSDTTSFMEIPL